MRADVQYEVLEREHQVGAVGVDGAAQQRAHAREQLAKSERLDEIVVGSGVQARDAVVHLPAGGQHQHRGAVAALAKDTAHLQPVDVRHRDVQDHGLVAGRPEKVERLSAVRRLRDRVALERQGACQCALHRRLIVDDEYRACSAILRS